MGKRGGNARDMSGLSRDIPGEIMSLTEVGISGRMFSLGENDDFETC